LDSEDVFRKLESALLVGRHPVLKVFVSSTFEDLSAERLDVQDALLMCGCYPKFGENAPLLPGYQLEDQIKGWLRDIDLVILLVGERYGTRSRRNPATSWTELEAQIAHRSGKIIFTYFLPTGEAART
jgi:hypothetical protein